MSTPEIVPRPELILPQFTSHDYAEGIEHYLETGEALAADQLLGFDYKSIPKIFKPIRVATYADRTYRSETKVSTALGALLQKYFDSAFSEA